MDDVPRKDQKRCVILNPKARSVKARKVRCFLAVSQTSASASPENNRQPEQDDCDRHKRRAGDVSDQDEEDGDNGEDCCDVVVHNFSIVGLPTLRCEPTLCRLCGGAQVA